MYRIAISRLARLTAAALLYTTASQASAALLFDQGFETDTSGWFDFNSAVTRVASGTDGISSAGGNHHAVLEQPVEASTGAFTRFGGYNSNWPDGYTSGIDIFLDTSWSLGNGFEWSVASSRSDGSHLQDFIFHVTKDTSTGGLIIGASSNSNFAPREDLENFANNFTVTQSGWYTFQHEFRDIGGTLAVDLNLIDNNGLTRFSQTVSTTHTIPAEVGGNRYGWFTFHTVDRLAIDNTTLETGTQATVPAPASLALMAIGLLGLGLGKRKRR